MIFNSFSFLIFFPITVGLYFLVSNRFKAVWLLICSYFFCMAVNPMFGIILFISTSSSYFFGRLIDYYEIKSQKNAKKICIIFAVMIHLGVLAAFKYLDFIMSNAFYLLRRLNENLIQPQFSIVLPLGISFYSFQIIGYLLDVYKGKVRAEKNFISYGLFVSFFPQLLAGPIGRADKLIPQLKEKHTFNFERMRRGFLVMLWGYAMKMIIADRLAIFVDSVYNNLELFGGVEIATATIFFTIQIYCDFAGYSYLALGAGEILGITLTENFKAPYLARSITEFWNRWHISLSTWFRDYLYFPLGGNRKGRLYKYRNIMIVFLVSGLWHGAGWSYIAWGAMHGLYKIVEDILKNAYSKSVYIKKITMNVTLLSTLQRFITFVCVSFAWMFFRINKSADAWTIIKNTWIHFNTQAFVNGQLLELGLDYKDFVVLLIAFVFLVLFDICKYRNISILNSILKLNMPLRWCIYYLGIFAVLIFGIYGPKYDASQFIYIQF